MAAPPQPAQQLQQQQPPTVEQQFRKMQEHSENCLQLLRGLRATVVKSLNVAAAGPQDNRPESEEQYLNVMKKYLNQVNDRYEELEAVAKHLPQTATSSTSMDKPQSGLTSIVTPQVDKLNRFLQEGQLDLHSDQLYRQLVESTNWIDANNTLLPFYADFLRGSAAARRRTSAFAKQPMVFSPTNFESTPHFLFTQNFTHLANDYQTKRNAGIQGRFIEKSPSSAIVELKFGPYGDKQATCNFKMAILVNNGSFDMFQIIASHEDWVYLDGNRQQQIDIFEGSKYIVYQKMTAHMNSVTASIALTFQQVAEENHFKHMVQVFSIFSKLSLIMETKCRICQKILKDYLPPLLFDWRNPKNTVHETCR